MANRRTPVPNGARSNMQLDKAQHFAIPYHHEDRKYSLFENEIVENSGSCQDMENTTQGSLF